MDSAPIELPLVVASILLIASGVVTCFFGHKLFKVVLALVGFLAGAVAGAVVTAGAVALFLGSGREIADRQMVQHQMRNQPPHGPASV